LKRRFRNVAAFLAALSQGNQLDRSVSVQRLLRIRKRLANEIFGWAKIAHSDSRRRFVLHGPIQSRRNNINDLWRSLPPA
jgi:hypothetical protein